MKSNMTGTNTYTIQYIAYSDVNCVASLGVAVLFSKIREIRSRINFFDFNQSFKRSNYFGVLIYLSYHLFNVRNRLDEPMNEHIKSFRKKLHRFRNEKRQYRVTIENGKNQKSQTFL